MGERITVDANEWEKIKKDLEFLKSEYTKRNIDEYKQQQKSRYSLDDRQQMVFRFIQNNPNCNKNQIVKYFEELNITGLSRKPVFKILNSLNELEYITDIKSEDNLHTSRLVVNEGSILVSITNEMEQFKRLLYSTINSTISRFEETKNIRETDMRVILLFLDKIYRTLVDIYIYKAIFPITLHLNNIQILYEVYKIIIHNVVEMQVKYFEFCKIGNLLHGFILPHATDPFEDGTYELEMRTCQNNQLGEQAKHLMDLLRKINQKYSQS